MSFTDKTLIALSAFVFFVGIALGLVALHNDFPLTHQPLRVDSSDIAQAGCLKLGYKEYVTDYQGKAYCVRPDGLVVPLHSESK